MSGEDAEQTGEIEQKPRRRKLKADARKGSILAAARSVFADTGDMSGTTVRMIAAQAGISEGMIYRHFKSKDQLFAEAVIEPLKSSIDTLMAAVTSPSFDVIAPRTPEEQRHALTTFFRHLVTVFDDILPLLSLVLFGDPATAAVFYRDHLAGAIDSLAEAWRRAETYYGNRVDDPRLSADAVLGIALFLALEGRFNDTFDREGALATVSAFTIDGFFRPIGRSVPD